MDKEQFGTIVDDFIDTPESSNSEPRGDDGGNTGIKDGDRIHGFEVVQPAGSSDSGSGTTRRRGRPRGSRNSGAGSQKANPKANISSLENILFSLHFFGATLMSCPELELNEEENRKLAGSIARVSSLYDDRINPKLVAWIDLCCVAGAVYGPRAVAISARMKSEAKAKPVIIPIQATPINTPRKDAAKSPVHSTGREPRSPSEMFGPEMFGAGIPDAV